MAVCGTVEADGTVTVNLSWTPGGPNATSETVRVCVYAPNGCRDFIGPTPVAGQASTLTIRSLMPGIPYAWSVLTTYGDGGVLESAQAAFTAPGTATPPSNLQANVLAPATEDHGAAVRFTWERAKPEGSLLYEEFVLGQARHDGVVALASQTDIRRIPPGQTPEVNADADPGELAWYVKALFSGGIELDSPIHALSIALPPPPAGEVMPISLWHAINWWVSYYRLQGNSRVDNIGGYSSVDLLAAIAGAESGGYWVLNPCPRNPSGATGPFQLLGWLSNDLACAAWSATEKACDLLFNSASGVNNWTVWPGSVAAFYNLNMTGRVWDGYNLRVHRVSATCFETFPCDNPVVDLSLPGSVTYNIQEFQGEYLVTFRLFNQTPNVAVFTTISLAGVTDSYDVLPGDNLWLPDWSGEILLSPAIPQIMPGTTGVLTLKLKPKIAGSLPPIGYRIYGANVGAGSLDLSNSAMGIVEGQLSIPFGPIQEQVSTTGQRLNADLQFDHQGSAATLSANVTVTGSGIIKQSTVSIPVANDSVPRAYRVPVYLGRVTDADPRGEWQAQATISHRNKELTSKVLAQAYLVS